MKTINSASLLSLLLLTGHATCSSATLEESVEAYTARLQDIFQQELENQNETFALWIGIADPDYGDLFFVLGNSTGGSPPDTAATLDQHFDIGSISKTMGGTTILRLAEQGKFQLEDTVQALVPDFATEFPEYANYTVEDLLRMKTLVPDFLNDPDGLLNEYSQNITKRYSEEEVVAFALQKYPAEPGTYSTTNFVVLDVLAEAVTNRSIQDLVQELVFDPLQLDQTEMPDRFSSGVHPEPAATPYAGPGCAKEFHKFGYTDVQVYDDVTNFSQGIVMAGSGGDIHSNIGDLLTWAKSGLGDTLLSPEMVEKRHVYDSLLVWGMIQYGMAQYQFSPLYELYNGWYGHNGDAFGFGANAFRNDILNVSVATGINTCGNTDMHDMVIRVVTQEMKARNNVTSLEQEETTMDNNETGTPTTDAPVVDNAGSDVITTTDATTTPPTAGEGTSETPSPTTEAPESSSAHPVSFRNAAMALALLSIVLF